MLVFGYLARNETVLVQIKILPGVIEIHIDEPMIRENIKNAAIMQFYIPILSDDMNTQKTTLCLHPLLKVQAIHRRFRHRGE